MATTDRDTLIERRLRRVNTALGKAIDDMIAATRRVQRLRARASRIEASLERGSADRKAAALKAKETRKARAASKGLGARRIRIEE